ncbi:hypothetical protein TNCV_182721 [Trichonephila clavipes]|nr:hypothetical protein TNCV_182721 [Trichonephila clavipes]
MIILSNIRVSHFYKHSSESFSFYSPPGNTKLDFSLLTFTSKTILCGDFNAHSRRWNYSDLNSAGKVIKDLLIADQMELLYNDSDIPTYLHYNGNGTNPDLTSADIADYVEREVICDRAWLRPPHDYYWDWF